MARSYTYSSIETVRTLVATVVSEPEGPVAKELHAEAAQGGYRLHASTYETLKRDYPGVARRFPESLPSRLNILSTSAKTVKSEALGVRTVVLYLSPAGESGLDLCPFASAGCRATCLGHSSGRMAMSASKRARLWRTGLMLGSPRVFAYLLAKDLIRAAKSAARDGKTLAVRLDGTSDIGIMDGALARVLKATLPAPVECYDYTKNVHRAIAYANDPDLHITFSASGDNEDDVNAALDHGCAVAEVYNPKDYAPLGLPSSEVSAKRSVEVVDGDESDARFLDRERFGIAPLEGYIVGLRFKSGSRKLKSAGSFVH